MQPKRGKYWVPVLLQESRWLLGVLLGVFFSLWKWGSQSLEECIQGWRLQEMSSYFPLKTMWRSYFCALVATAVLAVGTDYDWAFAYGIDGPWSRLWTLSGLASLSCSRSDTTDRGISSRWFSSSSSVFLEDCMALSSWNGTYGQWHFGRNIFQSTPSWRLHFSRRVRRYSAILICF